MPRQPSRTRFPAILGVNQRQENMKITITNEFTGFEKTTSSDFVATIKEIIKNAKAIDCASEAKITGEDGERYQIVNIGNGEELKCVG